MNKVVFITCIALQACSGTTEKKKETIISPEMSEEQKEYDIEYDSLGFPSYYTHPEITNSDKFRELLSGCDKVLAYNFNGNNGNSANVDCYDLYDIESGKICNTAENKRELSTKQIHFLIDIVCNDTTYTGGWSGLAGVCFVPHLGFGFFKGDTIIAQINICFVCEGVRTRPYYFSDGLSKYGVNQFKGLATELNLNIIDASSDLSG